MAAEWKLIAQLVSRTSQLQSLSFSCPQAIPLVLLRAIDSYPATIRLSISDWTRSAAFAPHNDPIELALAASPALWSIEATLHHTRRSPKDLRLPAFRRIAKSAPNLQFVMLTLTCDPRTSERETREWEVRASKYCTPFDSIPSGPQYLKIKGEDLETNWKGNDLSRLLNLDYSGYLPVQMAASLTSLAHLTLRMNSRDRPIDDVLRACFPLTSLSIVGWCRVIQLETIFTCHGKSLHLLALHEFERRDPKNTRPVLSVQELRCICDRCTHLSELSIDMNLPEIIVLEPSDPTANENHSDVYKTLSTFPFLRRFQLSLNLGISSYGSRARGPCPVVGESFVEQMWHAINHGRAPSAKLKELRVARGEALREIAFEHPTSWMMWEQSAHHWFKVLPSERDDDCDGIRITRHRDLPDFGYDIWKECM